MTDIKDLIIAKQEELIKELSYSKYSQDAFIIQRLESELASLKAQIPDTIINPNNFECTCGGYPECICEMKKHWKTGDSEYVKSLTSDTEAGKDELYGVVIDIEKIWVTPDADWHKRALTQNAIETYLKSKQ